MKPMLALLGVFFCVPCSATRWERLGPDGGRVPALATAPGNPAIAYAAGAAVFRSVDAGAHWSRCADPFPSIAPSAAPPLVTRMAVSPIDPNRVLIGSAQGAFLTTDGGASWKRAGTISVDVASLAFSADGRRAYVSGGDTVFRSANAGDTWLSGAFPTMVAMCGDSRGQSYMFGARRVADAQGRTLCRTDDGVNWYILPAPAMGITALSTWRDGQNVYAAAAGTAAGLYRVNRSNWAAARIQTESPIAFALQTPTGCLVSAVDGENGQAAAFQSLDDGVTWTRLENGLGWRGPLSLTMTQYDVPLCGTDRIGVMRLGDDAIWRSSNSGLDMARVLWAGQGSGANRPLLAALPDGLYRSDDDGDHWTMCHASAERSVLAMSPARAARIYHTGKDGLQRSEDNGHTWIGAASGLPSAAGIARLVAHPTLADTVWAVLDTGAVYRSKTGIPTWKQVCPAWTTAPPSAPELLICQASPSTVYLVGADGLYRSLDSGATWTLRGACPPTASLAADPTDANVLYRATTSGTTVSASRSMDGGATWSTLYQETGAAGSGFAHAFIAADERQPGRLLLGTNRGLRVRDAPASAWRAESIGAAATFCTAWAPAWGSADLLGTGGAGLLMGQPDHAFGALDAVAILRLLASGDPLTGEQIAWGDGNADGELTVRDADLALRAALGR
ncbi:MAG TPA: hypothetical protein VGM37_18560 [Armatimonadota bacterium]|jgi:hypothetical protein